MEEPIVIRWAVDERAQFHGRNGTGCCTGLELFWLGGRDVIDLQPITSRGVLGNCHIEIPRRQVGPLLRALKALAGQVRPSAHPTARRRR